MLLVSQPLSIREIGPGGRGSVLPSNSYRRTMLLTRLFGLCRFYGSFGRILMLNISVVPSFVDMYESQLTFKDRLRSRGLRVWRFGD